jgi:S1-C subfamily serine protease
MAEKIWAALSNDIAETAAEAGQSVVAVHERRHPSSGVVFARDAVIAVSHAVKRDDEIAVTVAPGASTRAKVAGRDPGTDLAVLRLEQPLETKIARWGDASKLRVGDLVLALGRSWRGNVVASSGVVSGLIHAPWRTWRGGELDQFIRPDLTMYPGFSGGPLVAAGGEFLGVNTAGLHRQGITIPAATVVRVAKELLEKGRIERPYLGLGMQAVPLPESLRTKLNLKASEGLLVVHLEPAGPAEKAGMLLGDVLIELDGQLVADTEGVQEALRKRKVGDAAEATLVRAGATTKLKVVLEARPAR